MIYKIGMLCKHFKGESLEDKNIYRIVEIGVSGNSIDESQITYTGDGELKTATNLVVYANIFQDNKLFAREYDDISSELSDEKKVQFNQTLRVQPLTDDEISIVNSPDFISMKKQKVKEKFGDLKRK